MLYAAFQKFLAYAKEKQQDALTPQGKQSVRKLMGHGVNTNSIPLDGDAKLFDKIARKYNVDYAFHKIDKGKYLLFFKAGQADAITAAFADYSKRVMARGSRPSILQQLKQFGDMIRNKPREHERARRGGRDER